MATELESALAFVARREGRRAMPATRWVHVLSLDLGWMAPAEAREYVARATEAALLRDEGEELRFTLDPATVDVPRGFRPRAPGAPAGASPATPREAMRSNASLAASRRPSAPATAAPAAVPAGEAPMARPVDPFLDWVDRLASHGKVERRDVLAQVAGVQERMGGSLSALAALLWLCARAGLDVREAAAAAKV